ncbi:MAG: 30S ribosomal protein S27e [Candidatus Micrarchaeota archaeon]
MDVGKRRQRSKFLKVKCECGNEQIIFSDAKMEIRCLVSNDVIARPTGGRVKIVEGKAKIIQEFD